MNAYKPSLINRNVCLIFLATLALPAISNAETYDFKVVYAEVPGAEEIRAGNHDAAIKILESRAKDANNDYVADELATLCALYIVKAKSGYALKGRDLAARRDSDERLQTVAYQP